MFAWLPLAVWAAVNHRLFDGGSGEPLLAHFGIHVRCLVAIPLFILAEGMAARVVRGIVSQFRTTGIVPDAQHAAFRAALQATARLRDASFPWVAIVGLALAWSIAGPGSDPHEMSWAESGGEFGFGGWWFLAVARPVFIVLALGWLWRIALVIILFHRLARLELALVPTHPDRHGGLGFVRKLPSATFLVTLAVSTVLASRWMHDVVFHGQSLAAFKLPLIAFVVLWSALLLLPLLVLAPRIAAMKRRALLDYGVLVGNHGGLVHQRWILGRPVAENALLDAPELGPVADIAATYELVEKISPLPAGKSALAAILVPIALPMLLVAAQQVPLRDMLLKLLKTLV
ncbi:MAG: hypothetical protein FIB06_08900 [Betaproteobacteria bacterium]|nr:hypothetical protein [Betaproteobacteria bacterium]